MAVRPRTRRALAAAVAAVVMAVPTAAGADDLDQVRAQRETAERDLAATTSRVEDLEATIATGEQQLAVLEARERVLEAEAQEMRLALEQRARSAFKHSSGDLGAVMAMVDSRAPEELVERATALDTLARRDTKSLEAAAALQAELEATRARRWNTIRKLADLREEAERHAQRLGRKLEDLQRRQTKLEREAAGIKEIRSGPQRGTYACILQEPFTYVDSWGFARSGGRSHQGTDVMAPFGNEVYAFTSGTVRLDTNRLGGTVLYLSGDDGHLYYYAHLASFASGLTNGARVEAGQVVASNGNSGNARGGAAHVHFEVRPGGGGPINPYPWLRPVC